MALSDKIIILIPGEVNYSYRHRQLQASGSPKFSQKINLLVHVGCLLQQWVNGISDEMLHHLIGSGWSKDIESLH